MVIKYTYFYKSIILIIFLTFLISCNKTINDNIDENDCHLDPQTCLILSNSELTVSFNVKEIIVENKYELIIESKQPLKAVFIQGLNMQMGTVPVKIDLLEGTTYRYSGVLILGMCSEPKMMWEFVLTTIKGDVYYLPFTSTWPH